MELVKILKAKNVQWQSKFISFLAARDDNLSHPKGCSWQFVLWTAIRLLKGRGFVRLQLYNANTWEYSDRMPVRQEK